MRRLELWRGCADSSCRENGGPPAGLQNAIPNRATCVSDTHTNGIDSMFTRTNSDAPAIPASRGRHLLWQETRQPSSVSVLEAFSRSLELECLRHQGNARGHLTHLRKHHPESGSGRVREKKIVTTVGRHPRPCSKINSNFWNQQRLKIQHHPGQFTLGVGEVFLLQAKTHLEMLVTRCWSRLDHGGARADNNDDGRRLPRTRRPYPLREADQAGMSAGRMKCCALR